jgi:hypothetical protein
MKALKILTDTIKKDYKNAIILGVNLTYKSFRISDFATIDDWRGLVAIDGTLQNEIEMKVSLEIQDVVNSTTGSKEKIPLHELNENIKNRLLNKISYYELSESELNSSFKSSLDKISLKSNEKTFIWLKGLVNSKIVLEWFNTICWYESQVILNKEKDKIIKNPNDYCDESSSERKVNVNKISTNYIDLVPPLAELNLNRMMQSELKNKYLEFLKDGGFKKKVMYSVLDGYRQILENSNEKLTNPELRKIFDTLFQRGGTIEDDKEFAYKTSKVMRILFKEFPDKVLIMENKANNTKQKSTDSQ